MSISKYCFIVLLINLSPISHAITLEEPETTTPVAIEYDRSGMINRYITSDEIIIIDGVRYKLSGKGDLSDNDLIQGKRIKFNTEKSTEEEVSRVTRIWIE
jgi:hypothetical protein